MRLLPMTTASIRQSLVVATFAVLCATSLSGANSTPPAEIYEVAKVDAKPVATHRAHPTYPAALRREKIQGVANVSFIVKPDGSVTEVTVIDATHRLFGSAAVEAVKKWRFRPGTVGGQPVACRMVVPVQFTLNVNNANARKNLGK